MSELGQTRDPAELVDGDPAALRQLAIELQQLAVNFDSTGRELARLDMGGSWGGDANAAFQAYYVEEPNRWYRAADAFHDTAVAVQRYADVLQWGQDSAGDAIRLWDADDRDAARDTLNRARAQVEAAAAQAHLSVDPARDAAPEQPRLAPFDPTQVHQETVPMVIIDAERYPETAQHIMEAQTGTTWRGDERTQGAPHPSVVTLDRPNAVRNRRESLRGIPTRTGKDRDEYPPAMFEEGGEGASVKYVDPGDNRGAGATMGAQIGALGLDDGEQVQIVVIDEDDPGPGGDDDGDGDDGDGDDDEGDDGDGDEGGDDDAGDGGN